MTLKLLQLRKDMWQNIYKYIYIYIYHSQYINEKKKQKQKKQKQKTKNNTKKQGYVEIKVLKHHFLSLNI